MKIRHGWSAEFWLLHDWYDEFDATICSTVTSGQDGQSRHFNEKECAQLAMG